MQPLLDVGLRDSHDIGDFPGGQAFHVPQEGDQPVGSWQVTEGRLKASPLIGNGTPRSSVTRPVITAPRASRTSTSSASGATTAAYPVFETATSRWPTGAAIAKRPSA